MVRYSDEILDDIKRKNDIIDVVSQYVKLKRKGRNYFGLCPFHNEKSPSFSVSPDKQIFKCFGCGVGGNIYHFLMKIENISFRESVEALAEKVGVELPNSYSEEDEKREQIKAEVYKINKISAEFFHNTLYKSTSKIAQQYVKSRKLDNKTLKAFLIGYADNGNSLYTYLKEKGFSQEAMLESNLIGKSREGRFYDKFRNRLMFPIQDIRNRFIAFGGRVLDDSKPKYINSPENMVYIKGRHLFGLNVAKREETGPLSRILIVEGYMDAISLYQRGITNVVASLGTALTDNQGRLLRKNAEQVILGYDTDSAGQTAVIRGMEILKKMDIDTRVLQLNGAKDPDEFVVKYGIEKFKKYMDNAISVVEFKIKNLLKNLDLQNTNDKIKFLNQLAKILAEVKNTMEREVYVDKISKTYNISKEAIYAEVNKLIYVNEANQSIIERAIPFKTKEIERKTDLKSFEREKMVIYLLINHHKEAYETIKNTVKIELIKDERHREIIKILYENFERNLEPENATDWFENQEIINYLSGIIINNMEINDTNKALEDIKNAYNRESKVLRRNEILSKLENRNELSAEEAGKLEAELNNIIIELAKMK